MDGSIGVKQKRGFCFSLTSPPIAQLVEQLPLKELVVGSIPTGWTTYTNSPCGLFVYVVQGTALSQSDRGEKVSKHLFTNREYFGFFCIRTKILSNS